MWPEVLLLTATSVFVFFAMTRLEKTSREHALDHPKRDAIRTFIAGKPGVRFADLWKTLKFPRATAAYHLNLLERIGHIRSAQADGAKRYFSAEVNGKDLAAFCVLRRMGAQRVANQVLEDPGATQKQLTGTLIMRAKVFRTYAKLLKTHALVEEVSDPPYKRYFPTDLLERLAPLVDPGTRVPAKDGMQGGESE